MSMSISNISEPWSDFSTGENSQNSQLELTRRISVCELLDRVLNKGAVLTGELVISVANIELLYITVSLLVSSVETLLKAMDGSGSQSQSAEGGKR